MTKIVLCYGIILGLYCLLHGVYGSEDDLAAKHSNAKHNRRRGDGYSESGIPKDKIFIKSESPLRGRKIHQTAWSEEVTENSPEEFKTTDRTDSWNFEKLYSYLLSLIYKTEEMGQATMTPSETVAKIRDKIKSEIKARSKPDSNEKGTDEISTSSDSRRLTYKTDFETSHVDSERIENYDKSEESDEYEFCEEDEDSSSEGDLKHKDNKENGSENNEDCNENEESYEKSSGSPNAKTDVKKHETTSAKERKQSTSKNNQLPGQEITVLNGTSVKGNQKPINILRKTTGADRIGSKPRITGATPKSKSTVKMNKDGNVESSTDIGILSTTSSYVHESTVVNHLPTNSGVEKSPDQFIQSKANIQEKVNTATESNAQVTPTKGASILNGNSVLLHKKKSSNTGTAITLKGLVTDSTQTLPQDNFEVIITAPEFIPISNKRIGKTENSLNKITEVMPNIDEMLSVPVEVVHVYGGKQSEAQKVDMSETEVSSQRKLQETKSETSLDTTGKTSMGDSVVFTQENYENMENKQLQQESFFDYGRKEDILEEYNLKNEFIELSDNNKNEFMNMLKSYNMNNQKNEDASQHSAMSQYMELNEENENQETFDTILEFLYKHSKNPLILSLRNSNKTLF